MNMPRLGRSRLVRSLVILGAIVGVFALHGMNIGHEPSAAASSAAVTQSVAPLAVSHSAIEGLEQAAMVSPSLLASDPIHDHVLSCVALLVGSLLMLAAPAILQRRRFADAPRLSTLTQPPWRPRHRSRSSRIMDELCVLRT